MHPTGLPGAVRIRRVTATVKRVLVVAAVAVVTLVAKLRERRLWASRRLSGGRKALVLNLYQRD